MYKHILAATDFSDLGDRGLAKAVTLAIELHAKLTLLHVMPEADDPNPMYAHYEVRKHVEKLEESRERARGALADLVAKDSGRIELAFEVRVGDPATQILDTAKEVGADLIVVASNGQRGFTQWLLGSVTDRCVRGTDRDVLVVT